jgi:histidine triad (HIT) family protein
MAIADPDCLFCKIAAGEISATIVAEGERTIAFMDINPATRGHTLVIPRAHARDVHDIDPEDLRAIVTAAQDVAAKQLHRLGADGVNLLNSNGPAAWQTVFHFHLHVIPRYDGDPLKLPWVPAPGDLDDITAAGAELAD